MRSQFDYLRPSSPDEAVAMKAGHGDGAMYWAGGTDMVLHWQREKLRPNICIDLSSLTELNGISIEEDRIRIGATTTLAKLERSADRHPLLATLSRITKLMCTPQTRSIATVGGNMCNASPAADLSPAFVAMDAKAVIQGADGVRHVSLLEFFEGVNKTALRGGDLLNGIDIPLPGSGAIAASYRRIDRTVVDIALVNASAALTIDGEGLVKTARIALGAVAPVIIRSEPAENLITGSPLSELTEATVRAAGDTAATDAKPISDVRASADYRRDMVTVMVRRALADCIEELKG